MTMDSPYLMQLQVEKVLTQGSQLEKLNINEKVKAQFLVKLVSQYNSAMQWQAQIKMRN